MKRYLLGMGLMSIVLWFTMIHLKPYYNGYWMHLLLIVSGILLVAALLCRNK